MSHRKFEHPRCGHLGFLPKKRARHHRARISSFPKDDTEAAPHLTAFLAYKAGMSHIVRDVDRPGSKVHKKEVVEPVSVIDTPPMVVVGITGYGVSPNGKKCLGTVWANHLGESFKRSLVKRWGRSKKKAFANRTATAPVLKKGNENQKKALLADAEKKNAKALARIAKFGNVVRVIAHTQVDKFRFAGKKARCLEIQVNGGKNVQEKLEFAKGLLEQEVPVTNLFEQNQMIDAIAVTTGKGFEGVTHRWGTTRLPRKTHKGLRKVACIGSWHPSRVSYTVPRAGQNGYHTRTETNKKIYRVGAAGDKSSGCCKADLTAKVITPLGGFRKYGPVDNDFLVVKGSLPGPNKRPLTLRRSIRPVTTRVAREAIELKFIDTSSKFGHGRFQTIEEKTKFQGPTKKTALKSEK